MSYDDLVNWLRGHRYADPRLQRLAEETARSAFEDSMVERKKVGEAERLPVELTLEQRTLILDQTFADPELTERLGLAPVAGKKVVVGYTLSDIEELMGFVAAEANHTKDRKLERKLHRLWEYLRTFEDRYEDELSAPRPT
jgi:hypothetical protein